jgi:UDP-glucuronate 4-epimerase
LSVAVAGSRVLVTGVAGFIGMHVARALLDAGATVVGVDNFDPYYDVRLKQSRAALLGQSSGFTLVRADLAESDVCAALLGEHGCTAVIHLAAQAGVRHSLLAPESYVRNNLVAFGHVLEACRHARVEHLVYASSSSVYGANHVLPFSEDQRVDRPVSLYAATKAANELMAHSYSHLFRIPATGLRFFTVYGPWGRPDQAAMLFTRAILEGRPIPVFNGGRMQRDFTYIDDVVDGVLKALAAPPAPEPPDGAPHAVFNLGNNEPVELETFIALLEELLGRSASRDYRPMQPGDVPATFASIDRARAALGFAPRTPLREGLRSFVEWYRGYYTAGGTLPG